MIQLSYFWAVVRLQNLESEHLFTCAFVVALLVAAKKGTSYLARHKYCSEHVPSNRTWEWLDGEVPVKDSPGPDSARLS